MVEIAIFTGFWYWICKTDIGYAVTHALRQPLFSSVLIGLIMGDITQAVIIGSAIQILYIGLVAAGSNLPADDCLAGLIAIPLALNTGLSPTLAIAIAVPIGVMGVFLDQFRKTINAIFVHMADKYAEEGNVSQIKLCAVVWPTVLGFFIRFPVPFLANMYGKDSINSFLNSVPEWLIHGFSVAGGLLPALGFALTIFVIGKKSYCLGFLSVISSCSLAAFQFSVRLFSVLALCCLSRTTRTKKKRKGLIMETKLITEKDVKNSWLYYYIVAEMGISYERLQALGFTTALLPILQKLYPDQEDLKQAIKRHLVFYNTEAVYGAPINGIVIAMEEQKARGADIDDDTITGIKTGLMGPMAGIGDSIDWATLKPIIFGLAVTLSTNGSVLGAFSFSSCL